MSSCRCLIIYPLCRDRVRDVHAVPLHRDLLQRDPLLGVLLHLLLLHDLAALGLLRQLVEHRGLHQVRLHQLHRARRHHEQGGVRRTDKNMFSFNGPLMALGTALHILRCRHNFAVVKVRPSLLSTNEFWVSNDGHCVWELWVHCTNLRLRGHWSLAMMNVRPPLHNGQLGRVTREAPSRS